MIKINLLPVRVAKKKAGVMQQMILFVAFILVILIALIYQGTSLNNKIEGLNVKIQEAEQKKSELTVVNKEKKQYEKNNKQLKGKIDIIRTLEKGRTVPVHLLDGLSNCLTNDINIWLTSFSNTGQSIRMEGYSFTNPDIARFINRLKETKYYNNVNLESSIQSKQQNKEVYRFNIQATVKTPLEG